MKVLELGDINGLDYYDAKYREPPEGDYIGFAIGPMSLVDQVELDGVRIVAGRVVPARTRSPQFRPVRAPRVDAGGAFNGQATTVAATTGQVNTRCQVLAYECGDALIAPGPRAPHIVSNVVAVGAAETVLVLRIPFAGRSFAQLLLKSTTGAPAGGLWRVDGIRYQPRELRAAAVAAAEPWKGHVVEETNLLTGAAAAYVDGGYIGGTDNGESWDELAVYVANADETIAVYAEAYDRASVGAL